MKKVFLHICDYAAPYKGNFIQSLSYLESFADVKNVYLFPARAKRKKAREWIESLNENGVCAYILEEGFFKNLFLICKIIKEHQVNLVFRHFYDLKSDAILKLVFPGKRIVRFFHCMYEERHAGTFKHRIRTFLWKGNLFVGVSEATSEILARVFPRFQICTVPNAIDFSVFSVDEKREPSEEKILLTRGYNIPVKGTDLAIAAVEKLRGSYPVCLKIITASDPSEVEDFLQDRYGKKPEWISLLPPTTDMAKYYNACDLFLSPSRSEGMPYAVIEAAYFRKSIVASRVGGQGELKLDGIRFFEKENESELYEVLESAIQNLDSADEELKKEALRKTALEHYSIQSWGTEVIRLAEKVLS